MVGGTLANRMAGTPAAGNVHAKTGTLTGATALSGHVRDPSGRRLAGGGSSARESVLGARVPMGAGNLECSWTMSC